MTITRSTTTSTATTATRQAPPARPLSRLRALIRGRSRSTTPRILITLLVALLAATVAALGTGLAVVNRGQAAADAVRDRAVPAISGVIAARTALIQADAAMMESLGNGGRAAGLGETFYNQIGAAVEGLTQAAGADIRGETGNERLRAAARTLTTYTRLMQQAATSSAEGGGRVLRARDLYTASDMLHNPDGGVLVELDRLLGEYLDEVRGRVAAGARHPAAIVPWVLATLALVALLAVSLVFFARRFRRLVNVWLVAALALLAGLSWSVGTAVAAHDDLRQASDALVRAVDIHRRSATDTQGQQALHRLISQACGRDAVEECGATVAEFAGRVTEQSRRAEADEQALTSGIDASRSCAVELGERSGGAAGAADRVSEQARGVQASVGCATGRSESARGAADRQPLVYTLSALLAVAVYLGFRPRLNEYRFRSR